MKYLCLAYYDEKRFDAFPPDEMDAIVAKCKTYDTMLKNTGKLFVHGSLAASKDT